MTWESITCVANTSVVDLDTDLVGLGRSNLNVLNGQRLTGLPGDSGLAGNGLAMASAGCSLEPPHRQRGIETMRGSRSS
jgi:hypothetical protein